MARPGGQAVKRIGFPDRGGEPRTAPVFDPASGEQTGVVALASAADVDRAVAGAVEPPGPDGGRPR